MGTGFEGAAVEDLSGMSLPLTTEELVVELTGRSFKKFLGIGELNLFGTGQLLPDSWNAR